LGDGCDCSVSGMWGAAVSDLRDAAARAAVWQVIEQAAKARKDEAKAELLALEQGDTVAGKVNGQIVGKASWSKGRAKLVVTNEEHFMHWLRKNHPSEVVESANPAYVKALEKHHIDGVVIDGQGEVVPGVELQVGDPYLTVRREKEAEEIVAGLLAHGRIQLDGMRELTPKLDEAP
jgi:hypothetical protein